MPERKLVFHVLGAVAELERDEVRERTMASLEAAAAGAVRAGGPLRWRKVDLARHHAHAGPGEIDRGGLEAMGVSRATLYHYLTPDSTPRGANRLPTRRDRG